MPLRQLFLSCFGIEGRSARSNTTVPSRTNNDELKDDKVIIKSQSVASSSSSSACLATPKVRDANRALCVVAKQTYDIANVRYPSIDAPDEVIIRTRSVGLNPIDWKSVDYNFCMPSFPWVGGREVAGVVEAVGAEVAHVRPGDRVWASTYYRDRRAGTFQELCAVPQHTVLPLPAALSFDAGACLGVAALTAAMTLWKWFGVAMPLAEALMPACARDYILIWGGSTVTGQFAIQLAQQSGLRVIAVSSKKTSHLAKRMGAEHAISRDGKTNDEITAEIRAITGDRLTLAIDIVGNATGACCLKALSSVEPSMLAPLAFLKADEHIPQNISIAPVEMKRFIIEKGNRCYAEQLNRLVGDGAVCIPECEVLIGLESIADGLEMLKRGDMNGRKLIVKIA